MFTKRYLHRFNLENFSIGAVTVMLMAGALLPNLALGATGLSFDSPEQAVTALYKAVTNGDRDAISQLLGGTASSDDIVQDKTDRERFAQKYSEMHRLVKEPDGGAVLYIGAENWPFPVPLVSSAGKWQFDTDAGAREILFRHVGENEMTAIENSRAIARGSSDPAKEATHGYQFRVLRTSNGTAIVAYPLEYGITGVMTFAVTASGRVYEKDLGLNTPELAKAMTRYSPDKTWHVAKQSTAARQ